MGDIKKNPAPAYPETVAQVLEIAARPEVAAVMTEAEADWYLTNRKASDWIDGAGRKIQPHRVGYDIKKWALSENRKGAPAQQDDKNRATEPGRENEGKDKIGF